MGLIDSTMLAGFGEPDAGLSEYQSEYVKFQRDCPALKGTADLIYRARDLYNIAKADTNALANAGVAYTPRT